MANILQEQYSLVRKSRAVAFNFIENTVGNDFTATVPAYQNQNIRHLLVHNADCYIYWLAYMALEQTVEWLDEKNFIGMADIFRLFNQVDELMAVFLKKFENGMDIPVDNARSRNDKLHATPIMIFTHVITHEFHHKGQVMSMCRQLGYPPPETDVYRFFY